MFDARLRPLIDPPLNRIGRMLAHQGVSANHVTIASGVFGILAGIVIAHQAFAAGLVFILASRLLDGLDGAVARASRPTDFGGYLDIVADFVFYVAVPVGFGFASPENTPFALLLVASFTLTGVSFLAYATIAAKRGIETAAHGRKSFFYSTGIAEGTETIAVFILMCLTPHRFPEIATIYAGLCVLTVAQRTWAAAAMFRDPPA
jgi:phosphatidylglycerophosphate synthase